MGNSEETKETRGQDGFLEKLERLEKDVFTLLQENITLTALVESLKSRLDELDKETNKTGVYLTGMRQNDRIYVNSKVAPTGGKI